MNLNEFCDWIISAHGWKNEIKKISCLIVSRDFSGLQDIPLQLEFNQIDWRKLVLAASILARSKARPHLECSLLIAQGGILLNNDPMLTSSCSIVLDQLQNHRTVSDSVTKGLISQSYLSKLGISARILAFKEEIESKIFSSYSPPMTANKFQIDFWTSVDKAGWLYALAPTASGKSYIVLKYILEAIGSGRLKTVVYVAPTRALVTEIEQNFRSLSNAQGLIVSVSSVPLKELAHNSEPCIYVFTQERLHIFLNTLNVAFEIDALIVDEVQKLEDGPRGVILQDAIERVLRLNNATKIIFLSPNADNPEYLFRDKPENIEGVIVDRDQPMVSQNILWASQKGTDSTKWKLELRYNDENNLLGHFKLLDRPTTRAKKLALVAYNLAGNNSGNMIYSNEPSEAEAIAEFIADLIEESPDDNLQALSNLARDGVHRNFKLVNTVKKGVAFHYGNMPSLLREEIERLFNTGNIKFLICTSTLIEGVNLSCKTIYLHGPKRGRQNDMLDQDFWNLAGRAGRWGKEFHGNIVCIDPQVWKNQPPKRAKFQLRRQTDETLNDQGLVQYLDARKFDTKTISDTTSYEAVLAYLLTIRMREGELSTTRLKKHYNANLVAKLNENLNEFTDNIDIPSEIIEKHSGISAVSMQTLLNYFRQNYSEGKKTIDRLIPLTPETDGAYDNMEGILRRIHLKLYPGFGYGKQYKHYAVLILNWMQGYTLRRLIEDAIKQNVQNVKEKGAKAKSIHTTIRDTMREVEEFARFKAPKYISCYTDVLKLFLKEQNKLDLYPTDYPFDLFLEFGVMSQTLLSLVGLGLSRMSATELGNVILATNLDKTGVMNWLKTNLASKDVPEFVKHEVNKKLIATTID